MYRASDAPYTLTGLFTLILWFLISILRRQKRYGSVSDLRDIPTIGPSLPILSYLGAVRSLYESAGMVQEGYAKYKQGLFKIADFGSWTVITSNPRHIEDIRKASPDVLAFEPAIDEALHTLGPKIRRSHFHVPIVQTQLTRELNDSFYDIHNEIVTAFNEIIVHDTNDWSNISAMHTTLQIVCRTAHRVFVGLPLCRDQEYISLTTNFALDINKASGVIRLFPPWLRGVVGRPFANVPLALERIMAHLRPLFEERQKNIARFGGNYPGKPQDLLSWFIDEVDGDSDEDKLRHIAFHILTVNFGAVYTTTMTFTQALYHLAAHPEFIGPLREEIEDIISQEGWTKSSLGRMRKLDSFFRESQRISGLAATSTYRRVLKPFTFSDGTRISPGTTIAIAAHFTHLDDAIYPEAETFKPFRFSDLDNEDGHFVTPSANYLAFGVGRHLCPGRFFTAVVIKAMMCHFILNYDVMLEEEGERPSNSWFLMDNIPNETAGVLLRKHSAIPI